MAQPPNPRDNPEPANIHPSLNPPNIGIYRFPDKRLKRCAALGEASAAPMKAHGGEMVKAANLAISRHIIWRAMVYLRHIN